MKTKILSLALLLLTLGLPSGSRACETLSLNEAVRLAVANNKDIKQAREGKNAAHARLMEAMAGFMPSITGSAQYIFTHQVPMIPIPANSFGPNFPPSELNVRLDTTFEYAAGFNAVLPLFSGGMVWHNYAASKHLYESASETEQAERQNIIYQVKKAFYGLLLAKESVDVLQHSRDLAAEHFRVTRERYHAGEASELDMLNAKVSLSNLDPQLIATRNNVKIAELALKNVIGVEFTDTLCAKSDVVLPSFSNDLHYYQAQAEQNNYQLKILSRQLSAAGDYKKVSVGRFLPTLAITGNYDWLSNAFSGAWQDIYQAALVLEIPLFNGGADVGRMKEASSNYYRLVFARSEAKDTIRISTEAAYSNALVSEKEIKSAQNALDTAQTAETIAEEQYRTGMATNLDVLNANLGLIEAEMNYIKAKYSYLLAIADLERIIGSASAE